MLAVLTAGAVVFGLPTAESQLRQEVRRLEALVPVASTDRWGKHGKDAAARLSEVGEAVEQGRLHWAVSRLRSTYVTLEAISYVEASGNIQSLEELRRRSEEIAREVARAEERFAARDLLDVSALAHAEAEASIARSRAHRVAAVYYAEATSIENGLYYLGVARAESKFAQFCQNLEHSQRAKLPKIGSLAAELDRIDADTVRAYRQPGAAQRHHSAFIAINAGIKEARELDEKGWRFGALLKYLEARLELGLLKQQATAPPAPSPLGQRIRDAKEDHSIAAMFLESADSEPGESNTARVILQEVLPLYFRLIED